jgi:hypothetical protein
VRRERQCRSRRVLPPACRAERRCRATEALLASNELAVIGKHAVMRPVFPRLNESVSQIEFAGDGRLCASGSAPNLTLSGDGLAFRRDWGEGCRMWSGQPEGRNCCTVTFLPFQRMILAIRVESLEERS